MKFINVQLLAILLFSGHLMANDSNVKTILGGGLGAAAGTAIGGVVGGSTGEVGGGAYVGRKVVVVKQAQSLVQAELL